MDEGGRITNVRGELELNVRIFLPPVIAKRLLKVLEDTIRRYKERFGEIRDVQATRSESEGE